MSSSPSLAARYAAAKAENATGLLLLSMAAAQHEQAYRDVDRNPSPFSPRTSPFPSHQHSHEWEESSSEADSEQFDETYVPPSDQSTRLLIRRFSEVAVTPNPSMLQPIPVKRIRLDKPVALHPPSEALRVPPTTAEDRHRCRFCAKVFSRVADVKRHEGVHSNERPFGCSYCPKSFRLRSTLKMHERTHTGEKPYECQFCDRSFSQSSSLNRHRRSCHPREMAALKKGSAAKAAKAKVEPVAEVTG